MNKTSIAKGRKADLNLPVPDSDYTPSQLVAYEQGYHACSQRPLHFPPCPYPNLDSLLREAWMQGADDAGRMRVYTNGVYTGEGV